MVPASNRWRGRPKGALVIRLAAVVLPVLAAVVAAGATSRLLPRPGNEAEGLFWWVTVIGVSTATLVLVERAARRLLPLAVLLKLSLAFPDRAPSRLRVALRAGTVGNLRKQLESQQRRGINDEPVRAAAGILVLVGALSRHDRRTRGHSERVRAFTDLIAEEMQLTPDQRDRLRWAALLHDVGKVRVHPAVLNKEGNLTSDEWDSIVGHPLEGAKLAEPLRSWLGEWADAIQQHHERWDGQGYPYGLSGSRIARAARIVAVADAFEVMTASRSYRRPLGAAAARDELATCAGSHFDPQVVRAFLNVSIGRLRWIMAPIAWLADIPFLRPVARGQVAENASAGLVLKTAAAVSLAFVSGPAAAPQHEPPASVVLGPGKIAPSAEEAEALAEAAAAAGGGEAGAAGGSQRPDPPSDGPGAPGDRPGSPIGSAPAGGRQGITSVGEGPASNEERRGSGANNGPATGNDRVTVARGQSLDIHVLSNDGNDVDRGTLAVFRPPSHGHATVMGAFVRYSSRPNYAGTDVFQYRVCNSRGRCSIGTVQVDVL